MKNREKLLVLSASAQTPQQAVAELKNKIASEEEDFLDELLSVNEVIKKEPHRVSYRVGTFNVQHYDIWFVATYSGVIIVDVGVI